MPIPIVSDLYKLFQFAFASDPYSYLKNDEPTGIGITYPDVESSKAKELEQGNINVPIRMQNEIVDYVDPTSSITRMNRIKEYEKLETKNSLQTQSGSRSFVFCGDFNRHFSKL